MIQIRANRPVLLTQPRRPPCSHAGPAPDVPPEPVFVGPLLMKPAGAPDEPVGGLRGGPELTSGPQAVPQKIELPGGSADEAFVGMNGELQRSQHGVHAADRVS